MRNRSRRNTPPSPPDRLPYPSRYPAALPGLPTTSPRRRTRPPIGGTASSALVEGPPGHRCLELVGRRDLPCASGTREDIHRVRYVKRGAHANIAQQSLAKKCACVACWRALRACTEWARSWAPGGGSRARSRGGRSQGVHPVGHMRERGSTGARAGEQWQREPCAKSAPKRTIFEWNL